MQKASREEISKQSKKDPPTKRRAPVRAPRVCIPHVTLSACGVQISARWCRVRTPRPMHARSFEDGSPGLYARDAGSRVCSPNSPSVLESITK